MKQIFFCCLALMPFAGCKKQQGPRVDIYLLKSFTTTIDQSSVPVTVSISNAVLEDEPLVRDEDIRFYKRATSTFGLRNNIQPLISQFGADQAFAVTVNHQPVYYGLFHPVQLSSIIYGLATIMPLPSTNKELKIDFAAADGITSLKDLDKRNDSLIVNALVATNRLR